MAEPDRIAFGRVSFVNLNVAFRKQFTFGGHFADNAISRRHDCCSAVVVVVNFADKIIMRAADAVDKFKAAFRPANFLPTFVLVGVAGNQRCQGIINPNLVVFVKAKDKTAALFSANYLPIGQRFKQSKCCFSGCPVITSADNDLVSRYSSPAGCL